MIPGVVPYATVSVHAFIDKVGNYAGFAAIVAVALLIIMVFVNARESAALRERAEEAEERLYRLEYHAEQLSRNAAAVQAAQAAQGASSVQGAPRVQPAPAGAQAPAVTQAIPARAATAAAVASGRVATAALAGAPAGVGAPALSSATRLIPLPEPPAATNGTAAASAPSAPAPGSAADTTSATGATSAPPPPSTAAAGAAAGGAAAGGAAAGAAGATATPEPVRPPSPMAPPPPRITPRPPTGDPTAGRAPRRNYGRPAEKPRSRIGRGSIAVAVVLLAVIVAAVVIVLTHQGSSGSSPTTNRAASHSATSSHSNASKHGKASRTVRVDPTKVTVYVLNGTSTNNLAADVSSKLNQAGFQQGGTGNYTDATQTTTTVGYMPGYSAEGYAVAKSLGLSKGSVHKVNTAARDLACAATPTSCPDQVIVTVGADLESMA
jgi:hypothetical protein